MKFFKLIPKIYPILGLELFVFGAFIGICAFIDALIVGIPDHPDPTINFIIATSKVLISVILICIWLYVWYYITKRLMVSKEEFQAERKLKKEKKHAKKLEKQEASKNKQEEIKP